MNKQRVTITFEYHGPREVADSEMNYLLGFISNSEAVYGLELNIQAVQIEIEDTTARTDYPGKDVGA
jgi:hypothetical protein